MSEDREHNITRILKYIAMYLLESVWSISAVLLLGIDYYVIYYFGKFILFFILVTELWAVIYNP